MKDKAVTYIELSKLTKWDRNYKVGDIDGIVRSIVTFGFNDELKVRNNVVMAGNQTLTALQVMKANGNAAPINVVDNGSDWLIPCIDLGHLSKSEAEAFAIAHNRLQELGINDPERLTNLLAELLPNEGLADSIGYTQTDYEALLKSVSLDGLDGGFQSEVKKHSDLHEVSFLFTEQQATLIKARKSELGQEATAQLIVEALGHKDA